jgi:hypothetical protein
MSTEDTAASEHGADAETTQVPPPPPGDEPELAWAVDDDTDEMPTNRHGRLMWAGLAVLVVAITAALVLLVSTLFGRHTTNNTRPQPVLSPPVTTTVAAAPPPPTVTAPPPVTVTPPAPTPIYSAKDQKFIGLLRQNEALGDPAPTPQQYSPQPNTSATRCKAAATPPSCTHGCTRCGPALLKTT